MDRLPGSLNNMNLFNTLYLSKSFRVVSILQFIYYNFLDLLNIGILLIEDMESPFNVMHFGFIEITFVRCQYILWI